METELKTHYLLDVHLTKEEEIIFYNINYH